jgi:hypothetical protein
MEVILFGRAISLSLDDGVCSFNFVYHFVENCCRFFRIRLIFVLFIIFL